MDFVSAAVRPRNRSERSGAVDVATPGIAGLEPWRILVLITSGFFAAVGFIYAGMTALAAPEAGSAAEAAEQLLRRLADPSAIGTAIFAVLIVALAGAAAGVALRRHAEQHEPPIRAATPIRGVSERALSMCDARHISLI